MRSGLCGAGTSWGGSGFINRWDSRPLVGADRGGTETQARPRMRSALGAATTSWGESGFMNRWYSGTSLGADASGTETTAAAAIARTERRIKGRIDTDRKSTRL